MERWKVKAMELIDQVMEEKGPQTHNFLYSFLVKKHPEKKYREVSRNVSTSNLRQLLKKNYEEVDRIHHNRCGHDVIVWGPLT